MSIDRAAKLKRGLVQVPARPNNWAAASTLRDCGCQMLASSEGVPRAIWRHSSTRELLLHSSRGCITESNVARAGDRPCLTPTHLDVVSRIVVPARAWLCFQGAATGTEQTGYERWADPGGGR
jgi:hypothetical protein